ncbi:MAG: type II secretion system F family protein [Pedococcus sp.]
MTTALVCLLSVLTAALWPSRHRADGAPRAQVPRKGWASPGSDPSDATTHEAPTRALAALRARWRARRSDQVSTDEVADALVLISLALRAGLPLTEALQHVHAEATGRVRADLGAVAAALRWGRPAQEAWSFAGPGWRAAAMATHMSEHTGAAPAALIERAAGRLREGRERERERAAARAGVLLVLPLGLGFLPAFACTAVIPVVLNLASGVLSGGS